MRTSWVVCSGSVIFALSCGDSAAPKGSQAPSAGPTPSAFEPETKKPTVPLPRRVDRGELSGLVRVRNGALHATAAAARAAKPPPKAGGVQTLAVLADDGETIKVSTWLDDDVPIDRLDGNYELTLFVRRSAVLPTLSTHLVETFADGTAVVFRPGLLVSEKGGVLRPIDERLAALPVPIADADVALSFEASSKADGATPLPTPEADEMACLREWHNYKSSVRVDTHEALRDAKRKSWSLDCALKEYDREYKELPALTVSGIEVGAPSAFIRHACTDSVRVYREDGELFAAVSTARASLLAKVDQKSLTQAGGCGIGSLGSFKTMKFLAVQNQTPAYFPDGSTAGRFHGRTRKLVSTEDVGDLVCTKRYYLDTRVCHKRADLVEIEE